MSKTKLETTYESYMNVMLESGRHYDNRVPPLAANNHRVTRAKHVGGNMCVAQSILRDS